MIAYNSIRAKKKLLERIRKDKRRKRRIFRQRLLKYAAVGLILFGFGYTLHMLTTKSNDQKLIEGYANPITLQLSDGKIKIISGQKTTSITDKNGKRLGLQNGNQLIYQEASTTQKIAYNVINVPFGKKFELILADGSKVHLNSGSTLRYPVQFFEEGNREVFLKGEGYFEVAKSLDNPFIVNLNGLNIRVLGTQFNVSSYPDDEHISTVLVEGSIALFENNEAYGAKEKHRLTPGYIANWHKRDKELSIEETDTSIYTDWMNGKITFNHMPFKQILKKLERNYNITIINKYKNLDDVRFTASFDTETINEVLLAFSKNYPMRYTINDDKIFIYQP